MKHTTPPLPAAPAKTATERAAALYSTYRASGYSHVDADTFTFRDLQQRYEFSAAESWEAMIPFNIQSQESR